MKTASVTEQIERAFEREQWVKARRLLEAELKLHPAEHWLMTRLAATFYERGQYQKALEWSERAMALAPSCPLVRWDYASVLDMLNRSAEAIIEWKRLLKSGPTSIARDTCGEGPEWAKSLLNDCRYRLGLAYGDLGNFPVARRYLSSYEKARAKGVESIYSSAPSWSRSNQVRARGIESKK